MDRREADPHAPRVLERIGEFPQGDIRLGANHLNQEIHLRRKLAKPAGRAALRLGRDRSAVTLLSNVAHRGRRTYTKHAPSRTRLMAPRNIGAKTLPKIQRIRFALDPAS